MEKGNVSANDFAVTQQRRSTLELARSALQQRLEELSQQASEEGSARFAELSSLPSSVPDVPSASARARAPLARARQRAASAHSTASSSLAHLQRCLSQRSEAAEARRLLELQQSALSAASKVERLSPSTSTSSSDSLFAESQRLARASSEAHRLFCVSFQAGDLPLVRAASERCRGHVDELTHRLSRAFPSALHFQDWKAAEHCLGALTSVNKHHLAEDTVASHLVQPAVDKALRSDAASTLAGFLHECTQSCACAIAPVASMRNADDLDLLGNSVVATVCDAALSYYSDSFSPGRPDDFLNGYRAACSLVDELERRSMSDEMANKLRASSATAKLLESFDLAVYSSLRFQEIVYPLERELRPASNNAEGSEREQEKWKEGQNPPNLELCTDSVTQKSAQNNESGSSAPQLETAALQAAWTALQECWKPDKLLLDLIPNLLRISLQVMCRVLSYVQAGLNADSGMWASTECLARLKADLERLSTLVDGELAPSVRDRLHGTAGTEVEEALRDAEAESLRAASAKTATAVASKLASAGAEHLRQLSGISATYRMANKPFPTRPSHFVKSVLQPVHNFVQSTPNGRLSEQSRTEIVHEAVELVTQRYTESASELMQTVQKTESSLARLKRSGSTSQQQHGEQEQQQQQQGASYTEKVNEQMRLDIEEHARQLAKLGVNTSTLEAMSSLTAVLS